MVDVQAVYSEADALTNKWYSNLSSRIDSLDDAVDLKALFRAEKARFHRAPREKLPSYLPDMKNRIKKILLQDAQDYVEATLPRSATNAQAYLSYLKEILTEKGPSATSGFDVDHIRPRKDVLAVVPKVLLGDAFNKAYDRLELPLIPGGNGYDMSSVSILARTAMAIEYVSATAAPGIRAKVVKPILPSQPTYWPGFAEKYRRKVYGPLSKNMIVDGIEIKQFHPEKHGRRRYMSRRIGKAISSGVDAAGAGGSVAIPTVNEAFEIPLLAWSNIHTRWIDCGNDLVELLEATSLWKGQLFHKDAFFKDVFWPTAIHWVQPCYAFESRTKADSKAKLISWVTQSEGLINGAWRTYSLARAEQHSALLKHMSRGEPESGRSTPRSTIFRATPPNVLKPVFSPLLSGPSESPVFSPVPSEHRESPV